LTSLESEDSQRLVALSVGVLATAPPAAAAAAAPCGTKFNRLRCFLRGSKKGRMLSMTSASSVVAMPGPVVGLGAAPWRRGGRGRGRRPPWLPTEPPGLARPRVLSGCCEGEVKTMRRVGQGLK